MERKIYTIYDRIAGEMGPIMIYNNDDQAIRAYPQAFENARVKRQDFQLVRLGTINVNTMVIVPEYLPEDITPEVVD